MCLFGQWTSPASAALDCHRDGGLVVPECADPVRAEAACRGPAAVLGHVYVWALSYCSGQPPFFELLSGRHPADAPAAADAVMQLTGRVEMSWGIQVFHDHTEPETLCQYGQTAVDIVQCRVVGQTGRHADFLEGQLRDVAGRATADVVGQCQTHTQIVQLGQMREGMSMVIAAGITT
jgi:hypothetical protein